MVTIGSSRLIDDRILLENTPASTRLQLRSWVSWPARIGLAVPAVAGLLILWSVARALVQGGIQNTAGVILASVVGTLCLIGPYLAARWTRHGVQVIVTPERFVIKRHWTRGGKAHDLALDQVRSVACSETGIMIRSPWNLIEIETTLKPEQRTAVVDFVKHVIENHLHHGSGASASATAAEHFAGAASSGGPALEFRYGSRLVVPLFESLGALGFAAAVAYVAIHNNKATDTFVRFRHIRLSRVQTSAFLWFTAGLMIVFALVCLHTLYARFARPGRLVLRQFRLEFIKDGTRTVREILYRDIRAVKVSPTDGTQLYISIKHAGGTLDIARDKLPRSSDFELIRDAITLGVERAPHPSADDSN